MKRGSKNNYVKGLQIFLKVIPDGNFGGKTEAALIKEIGKDVCTHAYYVTLFVKNSKIMVDVNGKPIVPQKSSAGTSSVAMIGKAAANIMFPGLLKF